MFSRIIFILIIGLISCAEKDFITSAPLTTKEFQSCQTICEQKVDDSIAYCMHSISTITSNLIDSAITRCYRIREGMTYECIREKCQQNKQNSPSVFKDFLNQR